MALLVQSLKSKQDKRNQELELPLLGDLASLSTNEEEH